MYIVQTKTSDSLQLKGLLSEPSSKSETIIVHIHGMSGDFYLNSFYPAMYEKYPANNIAFLAGENRGTHSIKEFNTDQGVQYFGNAYEVFEDCVYDIQAWVDLAKSLGYKHIWLQGHSLGTSKIVQYLSSNPNSEIAGIILLSPSDMVGLLHDTEGQKDYDRLSPESKKLISENKGSQLLSTKLWGEVTLSANTFKNFFEEPTQTAIFNYARPDLGWEKVNKINVPVLAFSGTKDFGIVPVMPAEKALDILSKQLLHSPKVKTTVLENSEHDFAGFDNQIVSEVLDFINQC